MTAQSGCAYCKRALLIYIVRVNHALVLYFCNAGIGFNAALGLRLDLRLKRDVLCFTFCFRLFNEAFSALQ